MKRLLPLLLLLTLGAGAPAQREWTVVYFMSYDNDLARHAKTVLDRIEEGVGKSATAVTVLADLPDEKGLLRHEITAKGRRVERLKTDDSASEKVLGAYLDWVAASFPAKRYAIVFLDHGGGLDEMCLDRRPGGKSRKQWLSAIETAPILAAFRKKVPGEVELLFLQQCGRGSIENLWLFRDAACAILASQTRVGAPNDYYRATLFWLGRNPKKNGFDLADRILWDEEQFTSLACVSGKRLGELPRRLDAVVTELLAAKKPAAPDDAALTFKNDFRRDERIYDLLDWLDRAREKSGIPKDDAKELAAFRKWVEKELVDQFRLHPYHRRRLSRWTGIGLFVPEAKTVRTRYADHPFYKAGKLDDLLGKLYPAP